MASCAQETEESWHPFRDPGCTPPGGAPKRPSGRGRHCPASAAGPRPRAPASSPLLSSRAPERRHPVRHQGQKALSTAVTSIKVGPSSALTIPSSQAPQMKGPVMQQEALVPPGQCVQSSIFTKVQQEAEATRGDRRGVKLTAPPGPTRLCLAERKVQCTAMQEALVSPCPNSPPGGDREETWRHDQERLARPTLIIT